MRTLRIIIPPAASLSVAHNSRRPGGVITQVGTIAETPTTAGAPLPAFPIARAEPQGRAVRPEFNGSAAEYFRIWIVNLFFTLITLGVYSAWAKVRKKKYFYGSTRLDGDAFDYFANPKSILKGRLAAVFILITYLFTTELYPSTRFAFWGVALLVFPFLIVRALAFNARNSAFRGLRFDFSATTDDAAKVYLGRLAVVVLTLGLAFPWFMARQKAFVVSHHAFGATRFECELSGRRFFGIYFIAALILSATAALVGLFVSIATSQIALFESLGWLAWMLPFIALYAAYAVAYGYVQARTTNLLWANSVGRGVRFESTLRAGKLIRLYIGNIVGVACTAGLLIPWAVVRTLRYRLENFTAIVDDDEVAQANPALAPVGATGQELGDMFNVDFGL